MRLANILSAAAIFTIAISAASAQGRIYTSGSGSGGSSSGGGAVFNGGSRGGGMVISGGSSGGGAVINGASTTNSAGNSGGRTANPPRSFILTPQQAANRPIYKAEAGHRDRDNDAREDERESRGRRHGGRNHFIYYPYYGYGYGYDSSSDTTDYNQQQQAANQNAEPEAPAPTIFENRPGYTPPPIRPSVPSSSVAPAVGKENLTANEPEAVTILVFRDGHEIEIGNYAIVGNTLYNLEGDYRTHKILLADLDLDKTVKVNEARGYQFRLPKQQGS